MVTKAEITANRLSQAEQHIAKVEKAALTLAIIAIILLCTTAISFAYIVLSVE